MLGASAMVRMPGSRSARPPIIQAPHPPRRGRAVAQPAEERVGEHGQKRADAGDQREAARGSVDTDQRV